MGSFSLVVATLACVRCGREREQVQVQFKTGNDHAMPWYQDGEHVPDVPPDTYEGIADAYCGPCQNQWSADEKQAVFEVLADGVTRGELVIKRGHVVRDGQYVPIPDGRGDFQVQLEDDRAQTPAEIAATGREAQQQGNRSAFPNSVGEVDYVIFEGSERVFPSRLSSNWPQRHLAAVGHRCSNPGCAVPTSGPSKKKVGAHLTAAAPGGPRYDASISPTERRSVKNAIWLCGSCGRLVDNDTQHLHGGRTRRVEKGAINRAQ